MANLFTDTDNYTAIANAIRNVKGVHTTYLPSEMSAAIRTINYPSKIAWRNGQRITGATENFDLSLIDISGLTNLGSMLANNYFTTLDLSSWDFSNTTSLQGFCQNCSNLVSVNFGAQSNINCNLYTAFKGCTSLESIDLSWITYNSNYGETFSGCSSLTSVNVFKINSGGTINVFDTFKNCSSLTSLDLSSWNTTGILRMSSLFSGCSSLQHIDISNVDFTQCDNYGNAFNNVPTNCEILVKDQASKDWMTSHFGSYTNVQIKA